MILDGLRISLFGEPHFELRGEPHAFKAPPKTLPLLAYLLLHRRSAVARETVAAALWPDDDQATAFGNLRRHLHYLAKALPPCPGDASWIAADKKSIAWNQRSPYWLDVEAFEAESQDSQLRARAVRLYSGDLYERCSEEWIDFERERLRTLQLSNLAQLCAQARERSSYIEALQYAQLMLAADSWREDAVRAIMETRMLLGDRSGALAEYERFASRLRSELQTSPLAETTHAYERIAQSLESATTRAGQSSHPAAALIGRRNELAMLLDEWQRAARGEGRAVFLGGEAGIGKTTLLQALCASASENADVFTTGASAQEDAAYAPFLAIAHEVGADLVTPVASDDDRLRSFESFAAALEIRARVKPLLLAVEDLHWAGTATLDLLRYLILRLAHAPVLILATYREFEVTRGHPLRALRRQLGKLQRCSSLALSALSREEVHELAALRAGRRLTDEYIGRVYERSDGNPLFVVELVRELHETGHDRIPSSIADIVRERCGRLPAADLTMLQIAAIAGPSFSAELLALVTGTREADVLAVLDGLISAHFLRQSLHEGAAFSFVHEVIREAVRQDISDSAARSTHARMGFALRELHETAFRDVAASVAWHFECGGMPKDAASAYLIAAEHALDVYANDEASSYARKALDWATGDRDRFRALRVLESVAGRHANRAGQRAVLRQLLDLSQSLALPERAEAALREVDFSSGEPPDAQREALHRFESIINESPELMPAYLLRRGEYLSRIGEAQDAAHVLQQALGQLPASDDPDALVRCLHALYVVSLTTGASLGELDEELKSVRAKLEQQTDARLSAHLAFMQCGATIDRDPQAAAEFAEQMLEHARAAGDVWLEALAHRSCGACATRRMLLGSAERHFQRCAEITIAAGRTRDLARVRSWQLMAANRCGRFSDAEAYGADGLQAAIAAGATDIRTSILGNLANTAVWAGDLGTAEIRLRESLDLGKERGYAQPSISSLLGEVLIGKGQLAEGIALIESAWQHSSPQDDALGSQRVHVPLLFGLSYLASGREQEARRHAQAIRTELQAFETYYIHPQVYLWSAAQLLKLCGYDREATQFFEAAHRRKEMILSAIDDPASREAFRRFIFNELIDARVTVDDPLHAWFLPYSARRVTAV